MSGFLGSQFTWIGPSRSPSPPACSLINSPMPPVSVALTERRQPKSLWPLKAEISGNALRNLSFASRSFFSAALGSLAGATKCQFRFLAKCGFLRRTSAGRAWVGWLDIEDSRCWIDVQLKIWFHGQLLQRLRSDISDHVFNPGDPGFPNTPHLALLMETSADSIKY